MARIAFHQGFLLAPLALLLGLAPNVRLVAAETLTDAQDLTVLTEKKATKLLVKQQVPEYPAVARVNFIQGDVRVIATVDEAGTVSEVHVVSGHPFLALAALKAVGKWLFLPAHKRQGPREFRTYLDIRFALRSNRIEEMPPEPERDLKRQIRPPVLLERLSHPFHAISIPLRVLVGPKGEVVDSVPLEAAIAGLAEARRIVDRWKFQPARWGALAVPWYLDVDVPVERWSAARTPGDSPGQFLPRSSRLTQHP
ncbi:MAG: energy transducer TonB [Acidobacteriia bacterium]|nr:energy transducer TonB [Terriglobia bacterium]